MVPPRPACMKCFSTELQRLQLPKSGKVISFSEVHVSSDAFSRYVPYIVAIADFDGIRIPGMIKNANVKKVRVGALVEVRTKALSKISGADGLSQDGPEYWFELAGE
jgi:uncharacterized OB-fold protein